jgi:hypothetical protein
MIRAFSGALALALTLLVLKVFVPEVADLMVQVLLSMLKILSMLFDTILEGIPQDPFQ